MENETAMEEALSPIPQDVSNEMEADDTLEMNGGDCDDVLSTSSAASVNEEENVAESETIIQNDPPKDDAPAAILKPAGTDRQRRVNIRANTLRDVGSFNAALNQERSTERKTFFDTQTYTVHYPCVPRSKQVQRAPTGAFDCGADDYARFPVALLHGQFAGPFRRFTANELKYLPIGCAVYRLPKIANRHVEKYSDAVDLNALDPADRELFQEFLNAPDEPDSEASELEVRRKRNVKSGQAARTNGNESRKVAEAKSKGLVEPINVDCALCTRKCTKLNGDSVRCAICRRIAHFACFYVTATALRSRICRYSWQCMECKQCEHCGGNESENLLIVCDRCDRTYHTFCLKLPEIPTGSWLCPVCLNDPEDQTKDSTLVSAANDTLQQRTGESNDDAVAKLNRSKSSSKSKSKRKRPPFTSSRRAHSKRRRDGAPPRNASAFNLDTFISGVVEESVTLSKDQLQRGVAQANRMAAQSDDLDEDSLLDTKAFEVRSQASTEDRNGMVIITDVPGRARPQRTRKPNVTLAYPDSPKKTKRMPPSRNELRSNLVNTPALIALSDSRSQSASRSRSKPSKPASRATKNSTRRVNRTLVAQSDMLEEPDDVDELPLDALMSDNSVSLSNADLPQDNNVLASPPAVAYRTRDDSDQEQHLREEQRSVRPGGVRVNTQPPPLHPIFSNAFGNAAPPLDLAILSRHAEEEVRISKLPSSTYSCSQVDSADNGEDEQQTAPVDLTMPSPRRSTPPISPNTVPLRFKH